MNKELLFMVFCVEEYKNQKNMTDSDVIVLFDKYSVFEYLNSSYETLHTKELKEVVNLIDIFINDSKIDIKEDG